jgi:hypothetical protein
MAEDKHEPGLPGSEIIEGFSDQVRLTIESAAKAVADDTRKARARWSAGTIVGAAVVAAAVSWLSPGHRSAAEWTVYHAGPNETCTLVQGTDETSPVFICHPVPERQEGPVAALRSPLAPASYRPDGPATPTCAMPAEPRSR